MYWLYEAALTKFDSEFPLLSPACSDKWKFLGWLSGSSPLGTPPSILTPLPHHLLLWVKNDHREILWILSTEVESGTPRVGRGGCCPLWTSSQHLLLMVSLNLPPNYPLLFALSEQHTGHDLDRRRSRRAWSKFCFFPDLVKISGKRTDLSTCSGKFYHFQSNKGLGEIHK